MYVTYNNLFKLLIDKGLNKTEFAREVGISSNTLAKLSKNELVSLEVLVRICRQLHCSLGDVVQLAPPDNPITINLSVEIEHEIRVKVEKELEDVISTERGLV